MPFGIPPSSPRARAAGDYCDSTNDQLNQLIVDIVTPTAVQCEEIEDAVEEIRKCVAKHYAKIARTTARGVDGVTDHLSTLLGSIAQGLDSSVTGIQSSLVSFDDDTAPPPSPPPPPEPDDMLGIQRPEPEPPRREPQSPYQGPALGSASRPAYESILVPPPPKPLTKFPCPESGQLLTGLGAPVGSAVWCASVDMAVAWLDGLGSQLVEWIRDTVKPEDWYQKIKGIKADVTGIQVVDEVIVALKDGLAAAVGIAGFAVRTLTDMIRCAWYYTQTVTQIKKPGAYVAVVVLKGVLRAIDSTRLGSQSYLGFTLGITLSLPSLETTLDVIQNYLVPTEVPSIEWILPSYLRGYIDDKEQLDCLLRVNGANPANWMQLVKARGENLTADEAIQYARRHHKSLDEQMRWLRSTGWVDMDLARAKLELYDELPSVQDHLHWLQRNVFDQEYVRDYGLMHGFEERFWARYGSDLEAQGYTKSRAADEYAAHWNRPNPQQMLEWVYRLRPDKYSPQTSFVLSDYQRILAEQDYTEYDRIRFAATAYKVPALTYLRDMHRMDVITDDEMRSYHQDLGYDPKDSEHFVQVDSYRKRRQRATQGSGWSPAAMRKAFAVNQLSGQEVDDRMKLMGFSTQDAVDLRNRAKSDLQYRVLSRSISTQLTVSIRTVRQAVAVGIMPVSEATTALVSLGFPEDRASSVVRLEAANAKAQRVKSAIARVRTAYHDGEVDKAYAQQALETLGVVPDSIATYISVWTVEITPGRRRLAASQVVSALRDGLLDTGEARARLHNLGYTESDTLLFLADARSQTVQTVEALQQLDSMTGKQQGAQLAAQADLTIGLSKKIVAQLKTQEPPSKLVKWLTAGIIDAGYARHRLRLYGWDVESIEKWIEEAVGHEEQEEEEQP